MKKFLIKLLSLSVILFISKTTLSQNLLTDGNFSTTTSLTPLGGSPIIPNIWYSWKSEGTVSAFSAEVSGGVCSFSFINTGYYWWEVQLNQYGFSLAKGDAYRLTFDVRSDAYRNFGVYIGKEGDPWTNLNTSNYYQYATTSWETKTITFIAASVFPLHKLSFELGGSNTKIYFDNIILEKVIPSKVVLPGTFQSKVGCSYDWNADGSCTQLIKNNSNGKWEGSFTIPAGCYEYKVAINGTWDINYGENGDYGGPNIQLYVPTTAIVNFTYDPETHMVVATPYDRPPLTGVSLAGEFQNELGCASDWDYYSCNKPALTFNSTSGLWEGTFNLPAGCYKYVAKELTNCNYTIYGKDGINSGNGTYNTYNLYLPSQTDVTIKYNPVTHKATSEFNTDFCPPNTVVLPGNFQSELGCTQGTPPYTYLVDWDPSCNATRLVYDPTSKLWIGTFDIPAGSWEYKIAYNNSWTENYGLNGEQNGPNIPLNLCIPSTITFKYNDITHLVTLEYQTSGICVTKFYDANANGYNDEFPTIPLAGIEFKLSGTSNATQYTDADGKTSFTGLTPGKYTVTETVPASWLATTASSQDTTLGSPVSLSFGNVCLGPGGGHSMGYWMNKNGQATLTNSGQMEWILWYLRYFSLKDANGNDFDPNNYTELKDWMQKASATNMAYMLSAQMASMFMNLQTGLVKYNAIIYAPGCGDYGINNQFTYVWSLIWNANYYLIYNGYTPAGSSYRSYQECLKNVLDQANNDMNYVQQTPCSLTSAPVTRISDNVTENRMTDVETKVWPNPANTFFNLRVGYSVSNEPVYVNVYDVNGKLVYSMNGPANKVYQFGQGFIPGVYLADIKQGTNRKTIKLVKQ